MIDETKEELLRRIEDLCDFIDSDCDYQGVDEYGDDYIKDADLHDLKEKLELYWSNNQPPQTPQVISLVPQVPVTISLSNKPLTITLNK